MSSGAWWTTRDFWIRLCFVLSILFGIMWAASATVSAEYELDHYIASITQQGGGVTSESLDRYKLTKRFENIGFRLWALNLGVVGALAAIDIRRFFAQEIEWESRQPQGAEENPSG